MKLTTLKSLYVDQLKDLYNAEQQLVEALPKMASAASSSELKNAFKSHLAVTNHHVARLRKVLADLDETTAGERCEAMEGLIKEGSELMRSGAGAPRSVLDAGLIGAAQKVEHYEIAGYGTARTFARLLGEQEAAELLQETLDEEGQADKSLTAIAQRINAEAKEEDDDETPYEEEPEEVESNEPAEKRPGAAKRSPAEVKGPGVASKRK